MRYVFLNIGFISNLDGFPWFQNQYWHAIEVIMETQYFLFAYLKLRFITWSPSTESSL